MAASAADVAASAADVAASSADTGVVISLNRAIRQERSPMAWLILREGDGERNEIKWLSKQSAYASFQEITRAYAKAV